MGVLNQFLLAIPLLLLVACSSSPVQMQHLRLQTAPELNENQPLAVDMVLVNDAELVQVLQQFSAQQWMARKQQFQRDYPLQLQVWEWELVPNETVVNFEVPSDATEQASGILLFADYATPGLHRARLDPFQQVLIKLGQYEMQLYANF